MSEAGKRNRSDHYRASSAELLVFHGPALIVGGCLLFLCYLLIAGFGNGPTANALADMSKGRLLALGLISILPSIAAYGTELRFSPLRFLVVGAFCGIGIYAQGLQSAFRAGQEVLLVPLGGGLAGIALTWALGTAGLLTHGWVRRRYTAASPASRRNVLLGVVSVFLIFGAVGYVGYARLAGPMSVEEAISDPEMNRPYGSSKRLVEDEGNVVAVNRHHFQRRATDPPDVQVIIVELPGGRQVALIQGVVQSGFEQVELDEVLPGQRVRFSGKYLNYRPSGNIVDIVLEHTEGMQINHQHVVVLRGLYPKFEKGRIEILD